MLENGAWERTLNTLALLTWPSREAWMRGVEESGQGLPLSSTDTALDFKGGKDQCKLRYAFLVVMAEDGHPPSTGGQESLPTFVRVRESLKWAYVFHR